MWHKDDVETLFAIAESTDQDYSVRNWAYDAIVATGDKGNKERIARLLHTTSEDGADKDRFRGVGVDELLKLLGVEGIPFIIEEVVAEEDPWDDWLDLRDYVPVRLVQGKDGKLLTGAERKQALEQLRPFLEHKEAMARGIAIYAIGLVGEKSDLEQLESMKKDRAKLPDWKFTQGEEVVEDFPTVGSVAEWAVNKINEGG
jgi:HEAT repeat protein